MVFRVQDITGYVKRVWPVGKHACFKFNGNNVLETNKHMMVN